MKYKIATDQLTIIDSDEKGVLECYIDARLITQRKQFDEYYVDSDKREFELDIRDLSILSEAFIVQVSGNEIILFN